MAVPERTVEQRRAASRQAVLARRRRGDIAGQLKTAVLSLPDLLELADNDETVAAMRVSAVLESLPRMGPRRAGEAMLALRVSPSRRLRGLGSAQRAALIELAGAGFDVAQRNGARGGDRTPVRAGHAAPATTGAARHRI